MHPQQVLTNLFYFTNLFLRMIESERSHNNDCNPKMIMSGFAKVEMSSSLIDCSLSEGGWAGRRGQSHHEWEGLAAGACDPPSDGE
ncbi:MAG: hypothetical protein OEV77_07660, partial [Nitrospira sp.]|nr:hypothetical protein [Nitrospira sp.]